MNNVLKQIRRSFTVFSALFITVVTSKIRGTQECGQEFLVQCAKPLSVLTDSGLTFASNKSELDRLCPDLRQAVRCIHGYTRYCMSRDEQTHFKELFHGTGLMVHELCRNESYQQEYLKYAPCMKRVEKQNEVCLKSYTTSMRDIEARSSLSLSAAASADGDEETVTLLPDVISYKKRKREAADEGIKSVCCSFQTYVECSTHTMRRACGEDAAQFSRGFLDKMSSSLIRMHCQQYGRRECGLMSAGASSAVTETSKFFLWLVLSTLIVSYLR